MTRAKRGGFGRAALGAVFAVGLSLPAAAFDGLTFSAPGADRDLLKSLRAASLLVQTKDGQAQDLFAAARADYGRIIGALYAAGFYSPVIQIRIDGREAANIPPMDAPAKIGAISVTITPGPQFRFSHTEIAPQAPNTTLPKGFSPGEIARSDEILGATTAAIDAWRQTGHAKAAVAGQSVTADHRTALLGVKVGIAPGPEVRFGTLHITGQDRMRLRAIERIAGFPTGEVFDPDDLQRSADRLRRTGVFSTAALTEAATLGPGNTLDVVLVVDEAPPRRIGFGADINSLEGLGLSGYWLHRNLWGGGERLRLEGDIEGIAGQTGGIDYSLGARLDRPATLGPNSSGFVALRAEAVDEPDYSAKTASLSFGLTRRFGDYLTAEASIGYLQSQVEDGGGQQDFRALELPLAATWDNRDTALDATKGFYLDAKLKPFLGFSGTASGARIQADGRAYLSLGESIVLAGRVQFGSILGADIAGVPRDYLFYSGGGGTVRGHPYQSLGVTVLNGGTQRSGGVSFLGLSGELRADITDKIGIVGFYDAGFIGANADFSNGEWHAGAGLGLRYDTGIGPIRLDLAMPVSGSTGDGMQVYVGIGQAF